MLAEFISYHVTDYKYCAVSVATSLRTCSEMEKEKGGPGNAQSGDCCAHSVYSWLGV